MRSEARYNETLGAERIEERTIATYRWWMLAQWQAGRRATGDDVRYWVQPIEPAAASAAYYQLEVLPSCPGWWLPTAQVLSGSTVEHISWGLTRWHALGRAVRWADRRSQNSVTIARWAGGPHPTSASTTPRQEEP